MPSKKSNPKPKPESLPTPQHGWAFKAIGTHWWVGIYEPLDIEALVAIQTAITERIELFAQTYSRFREDSLFTKIASEAGSYNFPSDAQPLFDWYRQLYDQTDGQVTPLIGQMMADSGYDATYTFDPKPLRTPPQWDDVMTFTGNTLTTKQPVMLDVGAAGKGYLVDIIGDLLRASGLRAFCIDAGGDMLCWGLSSSLAIGLENPDDPEEAIGVARLQEGALCASSTTRRRWKQYHHIMSPNELGSTQGIKAVWVTAKTAMIADGLTTALFFTEPETLLASHEFEYLLIRSDNTAQQSDNFPAQRFSRRSLDVSLD